MEKKKVTESILNNFFFLEKKKNKTTQILIKNKRIKSSPELDLHFRVEYINVQECFYFNPRLKLTLWLFTI